MKLKDIAEWSGRWSTPFGNMEANAPVADGVLVESLLARASEMLRILKWAVHCGRGSTEVGTQM